MRHETCMRKSHYEAVSVSWSHWLLSHVVAHGRLRLSMFRVIVASGPVLVRYISIPGNSKRRLEALINRTIWFPTKLRRGVRCLQGCEGSAAPGW
jgi:hypothetical protein